MGVGFCEVNVSIFGALYPSKSGLIHKHIVKHIGFWHGYLPEEGRHRVGGVPHQHDATLVPRHQRAPRPDTHLEAAVRPADEAQNLTMFGFF